MTKKVLFIFFAIFSCMSSMQAQDQGIAKNAQASLPVIDGLMYKLDPTTHTAMLANDNSWVGELDIPEQVTYEDETYTVDKIEWLAFFSCKTLTKVRIPKTVVEINHYAGWEECKCPFIGCTNLERIEVDEDNPSMCSIDGVLFSKDKTQLYCYPTGAKDETYSVPDGVTTLAMSVFIANNYLLSVWIPNSVTYMSGEIFTSCKNLKSVRLSENIKYINAYTFAGCSNLRFLDIPKSVNVFGENVFRESPLDVIVIRGTFPDGLRADTFYGMSESTVIYVQSSEILKFKKVFKGTVLPLEDFVTDGIAQTRVVPEGSSKRLFDLQGRRLKEAPQKGIYIEDGKKRMAR